MQTYGRPVTEQSIISASSGVTIDDIYDLVSATLILQETGGTITTDGSEQNVYVNNVPFGVYRPVCLFIDLENMLQGDTTVIRVYYRLAAGAGMQLVDFQQYAGADGGLASGIKLIVIDLYPTRFGVQVTIQRTVAGDRPYDWQVFEEA